MNELLANYKEDVLILFKNHYRRLITKTSALNFEEILLLTFKELNLQRASKDETAYLEEWFNCVHHHSFLRPLLESPFIEIIFHSHNNFQVIKLDGKSSGRNNELSKDEFQLSLEVLALKSDISWNYNDPFASFNVALFGITLRATLVHFSTSANGHSKLFLRKIQSDRPELKLLGLGDEEQVMLQDMIGEKKNVLISGGTGSGKTTLMRGLVNLIPQDEHIVVLEDTYEILHQHPGQTSFLAVKDRQGKTLKDYCAYSLRMSPDRILVGEMRSNEVVPFLLAMNTGHKGLMSTIHASSGVDALNRIALLFSLFSESADLSYGLVMKLVCKNIDYVVHMENKRIKEICRVVGSEGETPFYEVLFTNNAQQECHGPLAKRHSCRD